MTLPQFGENTPVFVSASPLGHKIISEFPQISSLIADHDPSRIGSLTRNLEWIPARGPLIISRGTTPNHVDLGDYDGQVHIVGEANMAMSAASALRDGALAPWQLR